MKKIKLPTNVIISIVIMLGFGATALFSYLSSQQLFYADVEAVSELTSENIFVNINNLMDRPMNISLTMANDTFLRDFMLTEAKDELYHKNIATLQDYLASYRQKYNFDSVFFVSTKTGYYYHYANGIDRTLTPDNPENDWYYEFLKDPSECALNVDNDEAKDNTITIFVNCKLLDDQGNILGVVGVGMETPYVQHFLSENEEKYGVQAFLIDAHGKVQLSSTATGFENVNLFDQEIYSSMQDAILKNTEGAEQRWYHSREVDGYVVSQYIPNLNWYLVVEKNITEFKERMTVQLGFGLLFSVIMLAVVISIVSAVNRRNKKMLVSLAQMDQLTGIRNRNSYEQQMAEYSARLSSLPGFGIGIFDLNNLKRVNDLYGHQAGDACIKRFSALLCTTFKSCPVFRIGGDEFALVLLNMTEAELERSLRVLREKLEAERVGEFAISAAFGYAFYDRAHPQDWNEIFKTADDNMYANKAASKRQQDGS